MTYCDCKCPLMTQSGHWGRKVLASKPCRRRGPYGGSMQRRKFISLIGGAAAAGAWPLATQAQQPQQIRRIGVLMSLAFEDPVAQLEVAALQKELQKLGLQDGHNIKIEYRWAGGDLDRMQAFAEGNRRSSMRCNYQPRRPLRLRQLFARAARSQLSSCRFPTRSETALSRIWQGLGAMPQGSRISSLLNGGQVAGDPQGDSARTRASRIDLPSANVSRRRLIFACGRSKRLDLRQGYNLSRWLSTTLRRLKAQFEKLRAFPEPV